MSICDIHGKVSIAERRGNMSAYLMNAEPHIDLYRLLRFHRGWCTKLRQMLTRKGNDYAGQMDVLSTFKRVSADTKLPISKIMQVQEAIKNSRIAELIDKDPDQINYEGLSDTLADRANYDFLHQMFLDAVGDPEKAWIPETKPLVAILANAPASDIAEKKVETSIDPDMEYAFEQQRILAASGVTGLLVHTLFPGVPQEAQLPLMGQVVQLCDILLIVGGTGLKKYPHMALSVAAEATKMPVEFSALDVLRRFGLEPAISPREMASAGR